MLHNLIRDFRYEDAISSMEKSLYEADIRSTGTQEKINNILH